MAVRRSYYRNDAPYVGRVADPGFLWSNLVKKEKKNCLISYPVRGSKFLIYQQIFLDFFSTYKTKSKNI